MLLRYLSAEETAQPGQMSTAEQYQRAYQSLAEWIYSSLDIYKNELNQVLYPVFVHCYFELVHKGYRNEGKWLLFALDSLESLSRLESSAQFVCSSLR